MKSQLRRRLLAARRAVPPELREREAAALAAAPLPVKAPGPVCAYWPVGTEPGSPALLDGLVRRGCRVLLPVCDAAATLDWAHYTGAGALRTGPLGLREPSGPRLGCAAIAGAALILVPALAVDHRGVRLGRGAGYYDRALPLAAPDTPVLAVVRDEELLAWLPAEAHDIPVNGVLTPGGGLLWLRDLRIPPS